MFILSCTYFVDRRWSFVCTTMGNPGGYKLELRKIVLIQPGREGKIFGKAPAAPYTLMRLASLVPDDVDVEIWHHDWEPLEPKLRTLGKHDLVGITAKSLEIEQVQRFTQIAHEAGVQAVVVGGSHATLMPEDVTPWADVVVTGEVTGDDFRRLPGPSAGVCQSPCSILLFSLC